jgi:hypothetical protein
LRPARPRGGKAVLYSGRSGGKLDLGGDGADELIGDRVSQGSEASADNRGPGGMREYPGGTLGRGAAVQAQNYMKMSANGEEILRSSLGGVGDRHRAELELPLGGELAGIAKQRN